MKLLVVEDDAALQATLVRTLLRRGFGVTAVGDGAAALERWSAAPPDAVVLDLTLPTLDGLQVLAEARARGLRTPVLILTARGTVGDRVLGLNTGADDYLVKPYDPGELLARLRAVERRRNAAYVPVLALGDLQIDLSREQVRRAGVPIALTQKEWALLRVMATRPERIHTRESLQDALYGFDDEADSNTLEVFISRLRRKLGSSLIQTVRGVGYRLEAA